jgi:hypothetical protein
MGGTLNIVNLCLIGVLLVAAVTVHATADVQGTSLSLVP